MRSVTLNRLFFRLLNLRPASAVPPQALRAPWWRLRQGDASAWPTARLLRPGGRRAVRGLHLAHPELGPKPLLAKLNAAFFSF